MTEVHRLMQAEQIAAGGAGEVPFLRLPDLGVHFGRRASRLRQLAQSHPLGDYLQFVAVIADAQHVSVADMPPLMLPTSAHLARAREHRMPPLVAFSHRRDPMWCDLLRRMLRRIAVDVGADQRQLIVRLEGMRDEYFEAQASKLLAGVTVGLDPAHAPLIGAALQAYWAHMVVALGAASFRPLEVATLCPCCGSRPTSSIVRVAGDASGQRYLHCALCEAEWNYVRIKCTNCESTRGIHYYGIEGASDAVKAECCDECGTYRKIFYQDKEPNLDPVADDLASLALDILVAGEHGKHLVGMNFMLIHGSDDSDDGAAYAIASVSGAAPPG
jgi:FdhE protein